ncbi:putative uncharacterized protein DDB_G0282133 isoform X2 [Condylostylus longicornis]|uniref:putative uncharacterized protein DDB_G0282133 isoform X2 n=1 Tax=Condylostylus longicornis TaxID=2530218 RepID=UPI00244DE250|nr:putative uncharacterized protein DDB_G0282133 isoform X2 [Condylostylus longicornis]
MSVVQRKSTKHQEKTSSTLSGTKQKGVQVKMSTAKTVSETIDDTSATTSGSSNNIYDKIYSLVGKGASTIVGQFTIEKVDNLLTIVEKTAKWSLPEGSNSSENVKDNKPSKLERPCGWVSFLFLIVTLRCARVGLSFGSIMIGNEPVTPQTMVNFLQTRRRKLRAIKYQGLKSLRNKQRANEERPKRTGIMEQLTSIFNLAICQPGTFINCNNQNLSSVASAATSTTATNSARIVKNEKNTNNTGEDNVKNVIASNNVQKVEAQKYSEEDDDRVNECDSDEDLHCTQLLDKYGDKSSDFDDPDYTPSAEDGEAESSEIDEDSDDVDIDKGVSDDDTINYEFLSQEKLKNLSGTHSTETKDETSTIENTMHKENGPLTLSYGADDNGGNEKINVPSGNETNESEKQMNSSSSSPSILPLRTSPTLSDSSPTKSTAINPVRVSAKIGLRVRCQDLARLSYGEECFFSPVGSPLVHDGPLNNYMQSSQLPEVVINSAPPTSITENVVPDRAIINTNEMLTNERMKVNTESIKGNVNNLKSQNNHVPTNQQNKKNHYNNYKHNRGRKLY